jgi:hypothetical protein
MGYSRSSQGELGCEVCGVSYVESAADHAFTAFLAGLTPGRVLSERAAMFSKPERKRAIFLRQKAEYEVVQARGRIARHEFTADQEAVAARWAAKKIVKEKS